VKQVLIGLALLVVGFGVGYVPNQLKLNELRDSSERTRQDLEKRLADTEHRFQISALSGSLGMVLMDAVEDNYGSARQRSTEFFDQLRAVADASDEPMRERLRAILAQRDEITAALTANQAESAGKLRIVFKELQGLVPPPPPPPPQ
jgi:hypothetical protein